MMRAELKSLHSPDIELGTFWPEDIESFRFLLQASIGPEGAESSDSFDFEVCTPKWLLTNRDRADIIFGRHLLLVFEYDIHALESRIRQLCVRTLGESWNEVATKLARFGKWEFEDYRP